MAKAKRSTSSTAAGNAVVHKIEVQKEARGAIKPALLKLAIVSNAVQEVADGGGDTDGFLQSEDRALLARALLTEAGAEMERALHTLGLVDSSDGSGYFADSLK